MLKLSLFAALFALSCADAPPTAPKTPAMPAGKTAEAWGFDFRIYPTKEVTERLDWTYIWAIRFAAQRWEQIVYAGHEAKGFVDMSKESYFVIEHDGHEISVFYPPTYLDWTNILVVVTIDDDIIEEVDDSGLTTYAYTTYFLDDNDDQYPIVYFSIPHYVVSGLSTEDYTYDQFYRACVHELGHALGFNSTHLERDLLQKVAGEWEYKGTKGREAFKRITRRTGNIPMHDSGHFDGYHVKWRKYFDVMFQGFAWSAVAKDKLISEASVGVLEDLGYWVRYDQADDTLLEWRNDPRNPNYASKPVAEGHKWRCTSPRVGTVRPLGY